MYFIMLVQLYRIGAYAPAARAVKLISGESKAVTAVS
jgi:hypothetical protein